MKIVFFAKSTRKLPSSRTRAYIISDYLRSIGYDTEIYQITTMPWWNISVGRLRELVRNAKILFSMKKGDTLFLQRTVHQLDFILLVLIRKWLLRRGYVFDFDDAIYLEKGHSDFKTRTMIHNASLVFPSSRKLLEYALKHNKNAHIITTLLDTEKVYVPRTDKSEHSEIVIGWTGNPGHYENMKLLVGPLKRLAREGLPFRFMIAGGGDKIPELFRGIPGLDLVVAPIPPSSPLWGDPREIVKYIQTFDIGVVPLQKTEFNAGKDSYKPKEYMACGVATVASAWGENHYIVKDKEYGLLADTEDDWYNALKLLIVNREERSRIAAGGRNYVCTESSLKAIVPEMMKLIERHA